MASYILCPKRGFDEADFVMFKIANVVLGVGMIVLRPKTPFQVVADDDDAWLNDFIYFRTKQALFRSISDKR